MYCAKLNVALCDFPQIEQKIDDVKLYKLIKPYFQDRTIKVR